MISVYLAFHSAVGFVDVGLIFFGEILKNSAAHPSLRNFDMTTNASKTSCYRVEQCMRRPFAPR